MGCGGVDRGDQLTAVDRVPSREHDDVGDIALTGVGLASLHHRHDLLRHHGRDRIRAQLEGLTEQTRIVDVDRCRRDGITDIEVEAEGDVRAIEVRRHRNSDASVDLVVADVPGGQLFRVVADSVVDVDGGNARDDLGDAGVLDVEVQVDVLRRAPRAERGEEHPTLEDQSFSVRGDRDARQKPFMHVPNGQALGSSATAPREALQLEIGAATGRAVARSSHANRTCRSDRSARSARSCWA